MKIVVACDSFKGSLDSVSVVEAIERGIIRAVPDAKVIQCPLADGGEGTARILTEAVKGSFVSSEVHGPIMEPVTAKWGLLNNGKTAVIEMAEAAGLTLIESEKRDPCQTTSYGVGELILKALDTGVTKIIVGVGGSATTDGGAGMAQPLGIQFEGCGVPMTGEKLLDIQSVDTTKLDERIKNTSIQVAVDVLNPLLGPTGAARVFGPQKGATPDQVEMLESGLNHLASFFPHISPDLEGGGAAGGLGWGMAAFTGAEIRKGVDLCLDMLDFEDLLEGADLVVTGEGSFDKQTFHGKAPLGVAQRASKRGIPTVVLAGNHRVSPEDLKQAGIVGCYSLCRHFDISVKEAMAGASDLLEELAGCVVPGVLE